jgi:uncharacterized protein (TIGR04255 family)
MSKQYKNPPITEAVCEFRFELENTFDLKAVDLFFDEIKEKFPKKKKGQFFQVEIKIDAKEKKQEEKRIVREFDQFFSEDEKTLIQLDKERLSIHKLKPYNSWQEFYSLISLAFNSYIKNIKIKSIQRIGLRYINNFEIPLSTFDIEQYFNLRPVMGAGLPQDLVSFMVGTIFAFENGRDNIRVQLIDRLAAPNKTVFVLDMDYFLANPGSIQINEISQWITNAHKNVENIFEAVITEKTKLLFD